MEYLYHKKPDRMYGDTLYPLNKLKDINFSIYDQEIKKYEGREHITLQKIPRLNCLWNDVLHLSPVHPQEIKNALTEAGFSPPARSYYKIPADVLIPKKTIIYLYTLDESKLFKDDFTIFDPVNISQYSKLSKITKDYYKTMFINEKQPLLFVGIPHILYKGNINILNTEVIIV